MKKTTMAVIFIGCLLLFSNLGVASSDLFAKNLEKQVEEISQNQNNNLYNEISAETDEKSPESEKNIEMNSKVAIPKMNFNTKKQVFAPANAGGPYAGEIDEKITFDASKSLLILGALYKWDFGDRFDKTLGYGLHPTHTYSVPGSYIVTLTITKPNGDRYQDITIVDVGRNSDHLHPEAGCRYKGDVDETIVFDASNSYSDDPEKPITNYIWHFGDGTVGYGKKVTHSYEVERVYWVTLELRDSEGNTRQDILHADIGHEYTCTKDLFLNAGGIFEDILDIFFDTYGSSGSGRPYLCKWFKVKLYYKYVDTEGNEIKNSIKINNLIDDFPKQIDIDNDNNPDITVNGVEFFNPIKYYSAFNNLPAFGWETKISDIIIHENGAVSQDDDIIVCLQFSLQILEDLSFGYLKFKEPVVRVGYHSSFEEEKTTGFSATHTFSAFLLYRLIFGNGNNQQSVVNNINAYPVKMDTANSQPSQQPAQQQYMNTGMGGDSGQQPVGIDNEQSTLDYNHILKKKIILQNNHDLSMKSKEVEREQIEKLENGWDIYPEHLAQVKSSDANRFSLFVSFIDSEYTENEKTTLQLTFDSFTNAELTHRKGKNVRDIDFKGADDGSKLTLSISRKKDSRTATLGILIDPIQNFGFHFDMYKESDNSINVECSVDNPPENLVLFSKSENIQGEQTSNYIYMKNLPSSLKFGMLPRLKNGYITVNRKGSEDFIVGLTDDLHEAYADIYVSALPNKETRIDWSILSDDYNTIDLSSTAVNLTLHGMLKILDENEETNTVSLDAKINSNLDVNIKWSLMQGYFELQRTPLDIDFDFSLVRPNDLLDVSGNFQGGSERGFKIDFNGLETGKVEISNGFQFNVSLHAQNLKTDTDLITDLLIEEEGDITLEWDKAVELKLATDVDLNVKLFDLQLINPDGSLTGDLISLEGGLDIVLIPSERYYEITSARFFQCKDFSIQYKDTLDFSVESFEMDNVYGHSKTSWFDLGSNPMFKIESSKKVNVENLHLSVGDTVDFEILDLNIANDDGSIYGEWNSNNNPYLFLDADIDFTLDTSIETQNYGDWEASIDIDGSWEMTAEWQDGEGYLEFVIGQSGLVRSFEIIHDDLTLELGTFDLDPGDITFEWEKEEDPNKLDITDKRGKLNISNNGVQGSFSLCKLTYDDSQQSFELEIGNVSITSGDVQIRWQRLTEDKQLYIYNEQLSFTVDPIKFTWDEKTITFGNLSLTPGNFRLVYNPNQKHILINNGISMLGPICSYQDSDKKLSVDLTNLVSDYSKTMTLKWYEDDDSKINGLSLDTDGANLVNWLELEAIKYNSSENTGRRFAIGGFKADNFTIRKNSNDDINVSGRLYIANHLIYSKLVNDEWKDLELQWNWAKNGNIGVGDFNLTTDAGFNEDIEFSSAKFGGTKITASFDLPRLLNLTWDVDFDGNGHVSIDTNNQSVYEIILKISKDKQGYTPKWGIYISAVGMNAENYMISWDFTNPPWPFTISGYIEPGSINDIWLAWNGQWYDLYWGHGQPKEE